MRFFLRSRKFKIICGITAGLLVVAIIVSIIGGSISPQSSVAGAIIAPFQRLVKNISDGIKDFGVAVGDNYELMEENQGLKQEISKLNEKLAEFQDEAEENDFLREFLELKEDNPDFQFEDATLISRDSTDGFGTFTINKGSLSGIAAFDPVITAEGLVGYVAETAPTYSKVVTILNPDIKVGGIIKRTSDVGIVGGDASLIFTGKTMLSNLSRSSAVALGDIAVTAGGGIFPEGLLIGTVENIQIEQFGVTLDAEIMPFVNIDEVRDVMVITYFDGQGAIGSEAAK